MRMNPRVKRLWVEALRSGQYAQTIGVLCRPVENEDPHIPVGYCCLGVLCEVAVKEGVDVKVYQGRDFKEYDGESGELPGSVARWAGLVEERRDVFGAAFSPPQESVVQDPAIAEDLTAAEANDRGSDFALIADLIEANL